MGQLQRAGQSSALDVAASQAVAKEQIAALVDMLRQLGGNPSVVAGALAQADPLNAPFTLYVDPYIGSDRFVGGAYNSHEAGDTDEEIIASKLKRIELQRLECGYTSARPFKTINRAAIEAAIITSKNWYSFSDPRAHVDCVTIVLSGGVHIVYNDPGSGSTSLASWGTVKDPTIEELIAFNPTTGGVLLPRGCSTHGGDLRKSSIRPNWVTPVVDEAADYSNRRAILKVSGTGFFFNATTMDKIGHAESVHLLDTFQPASKAELDSFYSKIQAAVGAGADLASALLVTRATEYEIVGPIDQSQSPSSAWDTTRGASPYIFNWSVRSEYGMGGAFWDGAKLSGLKSMVCANFTGTNQQKDMRCWQVYENSSWVTLNNTAEDYQKYINASPDNVRRNPARQTRHISAVNNAYIQKVSIFGIGQSEVTMADNGGEITDNGGNSTFGGCSAHAKGYKDFAFGKDKNWALSHIKVPLNLSEKLSNIRRIDLGVVASASGSVITLSNGLAVDATSNSVPAVLLAAGYTLASGTRVWVENPNGPDWRATLDASAWSSSAPAQINITGELLESGSSVPGGLDVVGRRVYIRRVVDTRTVSERRVSLILSNTASARLPQRDAVLQTDPARASGAISRLLAAGGEEVLLVSNAGTGPLPTGGVLRTSELTIRRGAPNKTYAPNTFYLIGTVVRYAGKHWQAKSTFVSVGIAPDPTLWGECYVHMPSGFNPEDPISQEAPILLFDTDISDIEESTTLGINWATVWTAAGSIRDQYRSGTDYLGVYAFLRAMGYSDAAAHAALVPKVSTARELDPSSATDFPTAPSGGAATGRGNYAVEFRRPSTIRLYNHQWEWAGFGNYSKAMPAAQQDMSEFNKFTYYFTSAAGGRVVPKGSNEDGYEVTPKGLEDIATGATISPENLGGLGLDQAQQTDFPNGINVGSTARLQDVIISGTAEFGNQSQAKTTRAGAVRLGSIAQLTATGSNAPVASTDAAVEANPDVVTVAGLNRWRQAQRLVSAATGTITIYVQGSAADRNLDSMFDNPPTVPTRAISTLARAAEYANAVIGGGNQTVEVRIAPGLYDPTSVWECNVVFRASDPNQSGWPLIFPETNLGDATTDNNYFDGSGYGSYNTRVNFRPFTIELTASADNSLRMLVRGRQMQCKRSVDFRGGFHFLGVPHLIKAVADGQLAQGDVITGSSPLPGGAFTTDVTTNVNTFLNQLRITNGKTATYTGGTQTSPLLLEGGALDVANIRGIVFGPILPSRKERSEAHPYIATNGIVQLRLSNIYIRGAVSISSAAIGVSNSVQSSSNAHYGAASVSAPWVWRQTHHTFIGSINDQPITIDQLGGAGWYKQGTAVNDRTWYKNASTYLPNHIHLLTATGAEPVNDTEGPFFDQFIHATRSLTVREAFRNINASSAIGPVSEGFVGQFGSNGYNNVKTRGVLLGNSGLFDEERSAVVFLGPLTSTQGISSETSRSIFKVAGISFADLRQAVPKFVIGSATFGEPNPIGDTGRKYNPIINTAAVNDADGTFALNMGLRSYARGISPEYGFNITPNTVL